MIAENYIKTFLPIQELDEVRPIGGIAPIGPDDLFLMSQMSAYASNTDSAVMVSKKINYKNFSEKISADLSTGQVKQDITKLSTDLRTLSTTTNTRINGLCTTIQTSAYVLSTYTNKICSDLCIAVKNGYIAKYGSQTCCFTKFNNDVNNPTELATNVTFTNGKVSNIDYKSVSSLIVPDEWRIAVGGIAGDTFRSGTSSITTNTVTSITYTVLSDSYVNCCISAWEDDSYGPLEVYVKSTINSTTPVTSLYETLNNPGGFSGKGFYNYYHFAIPVKSFPGNAEANRTQIIIKYADNKRFKYDPSNPTWYSFTDYVFYAVPSKDDIDRCVKKLNSPPPTAASDLRVYKLKYNNDGLISDAENVYYGPATSTNAGLLKIDGSFSHPNYALKINNEFGYTNIPTATNTAYGLIKVNSAHSYNNSGDFLYSRLEKDTSDIGITYIPKAISTRYGVVMLSGNMYNDGKTISQINSMPGVFFGVNLDSSGHAHVKIPYAQYNGSTYIPGVMRTGVPDTTHIRVVRSVYTDDDGIAKVNVATPFGVGLFRNDSMPEDIDRGYDTSVELNLNSSTAATSYSNSLKDFLGNSQTASSYGDYVYDTTYQTKGFYMATVVLSGNGAINDNVAYLQIACGGNLVTTIHPSYVASTSSKNFIYSENIGLFPGGDDDSTPIIQHFTAISNNNTFGSNIKLYLLIREMNNV